MIKDIDFAYAAGYIDGDGCFYIGNIYTEERIRHRCNMIINSAHIENINWFQKTFGGTINTKNSNNPNAKSIHRYVLKGEKLKIFNGIKEFLVEKLEEFKIFEDFRTSNSFSYREHLIPKMRYLKNSTNLIDFSIKKSLEDIKNTISPSECDLAYLAGFIDAECCLNIQRNFPKNRPNPTYKIQLQCNNSKSPCFFWISKRFGGQFHFIEIKSSNPNYRNQMTWRLSAKSLYPILEKISPFLKHKKPICDELIKFYKTTFNRKGNPSPNSIEFSDFYRPILEERDIIFHKIKQLNKKGI
ncbi:MAG: hypothetical protein KGI50_05325 [Patescibacteria group bacterium]|nr:hypothetical protein [Patescibacteria group bacterium]MDE2438773.1 hypothetical protein [Patescibacteria group bacterium]